MNGKRARQIRKAAGGQEITTEREYFYEKVGSGRQIILNKNSSRKRYQALKRVFKESASM
jgi:hypothetical protein